MEPTQDIEHVLKFRSRKLFFIGGKSGWCGRGKMGDADDFIYHNPTARLAVGGGEEESPEEMSEAASAVYEMLLSSDSSILDMMLVMVELLGAREPLAAAPSPPLPPPPVPPPTPPPPPPPPSFLVTHLVDPVRGVVARYGRLDVLIQTAGRAKTYRKCLHRSSPPRHSAPAPAHRATAVAALRRIFVTH